MRRRRGQATQIQLEEPKPRKPFDPTASAAAIERALQQLDEADSTADEINTRVAEALRRRFGLGAGRR